MASERSTKASKASKAGAGKEVSKAERLLKSAPREGPSCTACNSTKIRDTYRSRLDGSEIDEAKILGDAIYGMVDLLDADQDNLLNSEGDASMTQLRARTLAGLVDMWIARPYEDEGSAPGEGTAK